MVERCVLEALSPANLTGMQIPQEKADEGFEDILLQLLSPSNQAFGLNIEEEALSQECIQEKKEDELLPPDLSHMVLINPMPDVVFAENDSYGNSEEVRTSLSQDNKIFFDLQHYPQNIEAEYVSKAAAKERSQEASVPAPDVDGFSRSAEKAKAQEDISFQDIHHKIKIKTSDYRSIKIKQDIEGLQPGRSSEPMLSKPDRSFKNSILPKAFENIPPKALENISPNALEKSDYKPEQKIFVRYPLSTEGHGTKAGYVDYANHEEKPTGIQSLAEKSISLDLLNNRRDVFKVAVSKDSAGFDGRAILRHAPSGFDKNDAKEISAEIQQGVLTENAVLPRESAYIPKNEVQIQPVSIKDIPQIGEKITLGIKEGNKELTIVLHPEKLGRISVKISQQEQGVCANIITDNLKVKDELLKSFPELKECLATQGIKLFSMDVKLQENISGDKTFSGFGDSSGQNFGSQNNKNKFNYSGEERKKEVAVKSLLTNSYEEVGSLDYFA